MWLLMGLNPKVSLYIGAIIGLKICRVGNEARRIVAYASDGRLASEEPNVPTALPIRLPIPKLKPKP